MIPPLIEVNPFSDLPSIKVPNYENTVSPFTSTIVNAIEAVEIHTGKCKDTKIQHQVIETSADRAKRDTSNLHEVEENNIKNKEDNTELLNTLNSKMIESLNTRLTNTHSVIPTTQSFTTALQAKKK